MSLLLKLVEVMKAVKSVAKKGKNDAQHYDYVKASDVAAPLRAELATRGILMIPDVVETAHFSTTSAKGTVQQGIHIKVKYTFIDSDTGEKLEFHGYGTGMDTGDKGIYKAQTGALKYALRMFFLLPDESGKNDPEHSPKTFGDLMKPFPMSGTVGEGKLVKGEVLAKIANGLGEFIWRINEGESAEAKRLLNAEGEERDALVIDSGTKLKGLQVFRVIKLDPSPDEIVAATKGKQDA
jgi:hypothetical protein